MNINKTIHQHTTYIYAKEINMEVQFITSMPGNIQQGSTNTRKKFTFKTGVTSSSAS